MTHRIHEEFSQAVRDALTDGNASVIPVGDTVICDWCDADMTADHRSGGFMFGSKAAGPCCAEAFLERVKGYGEEWNIRAWCPPGVSFADWVRGLRGPNAVIRVTPGPLGVAS
jgi:hypothetical protein